MISTSQAHDTTTVVNIIAVTLLSKRDGVKEELKILLGGPECGHHQRADQLNDQIDQIGYALEKQAREAAA